MKNFALTKHRNGHGARNCRTDNFFIGRQFLDRENAPARSANPSFSPYYFGARYLDPKYSRWMSCDPKAAEYMDGRSNGESGGIFNIANLNLYHYGNNNPIRYTDPTGMELEEGKSTAEQLAYLKIIACKEYKTKQEKADAAAALRTEMRDTNSGAFDIDGLMTGADGDEKFMNETLRDFLNTSDTGEDYTMRDMDTEGWVLQKPSASKEHQATATPGNPNVKYVNEKDGREAVFDSKGNLVTDIRDKGTYNYAKDTSSWHSGWTAGGEHGRRDMNPYFRQMGKTPIYRGIFLHFYSKNDYNRNGMR